MPEKNTSSAISYCFIIPEPNYQTPSSEASTSLHSCMEGILALDMEINPIQCEQDIPSSHESTRCKRQTA